MSQFFMKEKTALAVVACSEENSIILWASGDHFNSYLCEHNMISKKDLNLLPPGDGIWIWVGKTIKMPSPWDCCKGKVIFDGIFREPTLEEWEEIKEGHCPWPDENLNRLTKNQTEQLNTIIKSLSPIMINALSQLNADQQDRFTLATRADLPVTRFRVALKDLKLKNLAYSSKSDSSQVYWKLTNLGLMVNNYITKFKQNQSQIYF